MSSPPSSPSSMEYTTGHTSSRSSQVDMSFTTQSVGSGDSDKTSYYCLDCDTRHDLKSDAVPYVCDASRNFDNLHDSLNFDNTDVHRDYPITRVSPVDLARYQIYT